MDTGADIFYFFFNLNPTPRFKDKFPKYVIITDQVCLSLKGYLCNILEINRLLGFNFLEQYGCIIDFNNRLWELKTLLN